jgi:hypothetical protein
MYIFVYSFFYSFSFFLMFKKFAALSAGVAMLAMATVVPVMAQTSGSDDSDINVDVNDYLAFSIANVAADCTAAADGNCPFGSGAAAAGLASAGSNAFEISGDGTGDVTAVFTELETTTNSTDGYNVTAHADDAGTRTNALLRSGGTGGNLPDEIVDSLGTIETAQAANDALVTASATGLALRVIDTTTSAILREADEDTQWGEDDTTGALWAALPLGDGNAEILYDTTTYSDAATTALVNWFVGAPSSQQTGTYSGTVTFTASVN